MIKLIAFLFFAGGIALVAFGINATFSASVDNSIYPKAEGTVFAGAMISVVGVIALLRHSGK